MQVTRKTEEKDKWISEVQQWRGSLNVQWRSGKWQGEDQGLIDKSSYMWEEERWWKQSITRLRKQYGREKNRKGRHRRRKKKIINNKQKLELKLSNKGSKRNSKNNNNRGETEQREKNTGRRNKLGNDLVITKLTKETQIKDKTKNKTKSKRWEHLSAGQGKILQQPECQTQNAKILKLKGRLLCFSQAYSTIL